MFTMSFLLQVAVKKMKRKFNYWEECVNLREVKVCDSISWSFIACKFQEPLL